MLPAPAAVEPLASRDFSPTRRSAARRCGAPASTRSGSPTMSTTAPATSRPRSRGSTKWASPTPAPDPIRRRAGAGDRRPQRRARGLPATQLGLLADRPRSARRRAGHCRHPRPHRLSRADDEDPRRGPATEPAGRPARHHHLGRCRLSGRLPRRHRGAATAGRDPRRLLPLGPQARPAAIHDGDRPRRHRRRRRSGHRPRAARLAAGRGLQGPADLLRGYHPSRPVTAGASTATGWAWWRR